MTDYQGNEPPNLAGATDDNRPVVPDLLLEQLTAYVCKPPEPSVEALATARLCLMDSVGCAFASLEHPACVAHLGPIVPGAVMLEGAKVIGTGELLDPIKTAFDNGAMIRWLDYNDTWLAAEWGHPSDNLGGLLAVADYLSRNPAALGPAAPSTVTVGELLRLAIQAHEIQGVLALENSFNRVGLDHVLLVKLATAGLVARLVGGDEQAVLSAFSHAWVDGHSLRTYRHAPNTSQRKSWAAGDATSRGVRLALMATQAGLTALASVLSTPRWGFADVLFNGRQPTLSQALGCYVMENILFKVSFPAEFHAQTAAECAVVLHPQVQGRLDAIERINIRTQESAIRIISKEGELRNYADRDHCLQYIVAVALLEGELRAEHYSDDYARNPAIDRLRSLMIVQEDESFSTEYLDPSKRAIANALQVTFADGTATDWVTVKYPLGHRRRREEAQPLLIDKLRTAAVPRLGADRADELIQMFLNSDLLDPLGVNSFIDLTC